MLTFLLQQKTYVALKSGIYLDYFLKKFFVTLAYTYFLNLSLFFLDKYTIEYLSTRITYTILNLTLATRGIQTFSVLHLFGLAIYIMCTLVLVGYILIS